MLYYDKSNGRLCIGARDCDNAEYVRFCENCIAAIGDGRLETIWVSQPKDCEVMERLK